MMPFDNPEAESVKRSELLPLLADAAPVQQQIQGPLSGVIPVECLTYSVEETAIVLGVDKSTVYSLITRGFCSSRGSAAQAPPQERGP